MNWNPYKRIAHLEERVKNMNNDILRLCERLNRNQVADLLTPEQAQAQADKRVRANAAARRYYAKRKAAKS
jgi:hypothetical protein